MKATTKTVKTKDTYEASFYVLYGGKVENIRQMLLNKHTASKRGYVNQWTLTVSNVPDWAVECWRTRNAYGCITQYVETRIKLKKEIKRQLKK